MSRIQFCTGRRTRSTLLVVLGALAMASVSAAPKFKGGSEIEGVPVLVSSLSPDHLAQSLLLRNVECSVFAEGSWVATRQATFLVPVVGAGADTCVQCDFRGYVGTSDNARAALFVVAGGKAHVVDLEQAIKGSSQHPRSREKDGASKAPAAKFRSQVKEGAALNDDFFHRIEARVPASGLLKITVMLLVERDSDDVGKGALLQLDSLDLVVSEKPKAK